MNLRSRPELRRISNLGYSTNSSRILNVGALERSLSEPIGEEPSNRLLGSGSSSKRFFSNSTLNRAIFIKHNLRPGEESHFPSPRIVETKVLIPFDPTHLELGGKSFFIGEHTFKDVLRDLLNINLESPSEHGRRDIKILGLLRELPSFDPFLVQESFRLSGLSIDRRYFHTSYQGMREASASIYSNLRPLIESAIGKHATQQEMERFVDQVWNYTDDKSTNLFFEALQIPRSEWHDIVFAWKALFYYCHETESTDGRLSSITHKMKKLRIQWCPGMSDLSDIQKMQEDFKALLFQLRDQATVYVLKSVQTLQNCVAVNFDSSRFRKFLTDLSTNMMTLGSMVTVFDQVSAYYLHLMDHQYENVDGLIYEETLRDLIEFISSVSQRNRLPALRESFG